MGKGAFKPFVSAFFHTNSESFRLSFCLSFKVEETGTDSQHLVQLCKFMHGKTLAETSLSVDGCHVVAEDLGFLLGRLNKCLQVRFAL